MSGSSLRTPAAGNGRLPAGRPEQPARAALCLRFGQAPSGTVQPHHRRVARALMQEAALAQGGTVAETPGGDLLLSDSDAADAARLRHTLDRLLAVVAPGLVELWPLPDGAPRVAEALALAARARATPAPEPAEGLPALGRLLAELPLERVVRRQTLLRLAPGATPRAAFLRLGVSLPAVAGQVGPLAEDPDLLRHAAEVLAGRLLRSLSEPAARRDLLGGPPPAPLLIELPAAVLPGALIPAGTPSPQEEPLLVALVPAATAAEPEALRSLRAGLRAQGWGLALGGIGAAALALMAPAGLAVDWIELAWSPALPERGAAAALRALDPARLLLAGCDGPEAMDWGLAAGIARFGGRHVDAVLAATRIAACPEAAQCTQRQCEERAAAAGAGGRAGCRNPALLATGLPRPGAP